MKSVRFYKRGVMEKCEKNKEKKSKKKKKKICFKLNEV